MGIYSIPSSYSWNILWYSPYHLSVRRLSPNVQEDGGWLLLPSAVSGSLSPWYGEVEHWEVYHYRHSSGPLGPIYRENISHPSDPSTHLSSSIPPPTYNSCCRSLQQKPLWFHVFYRLLKNNKVQWSMLISLEIFKSTFFWETRSRSPDSSLGRKLGWAVLEWLTRERPCLTSSHWAEGAGLYSHTDRCRDQSRCFLANLRCEASLATGGITLYQTRSSVYSCAVNSPSFCVLVRGSIWEASGLVLLQATIEKKIRQQATSTVNIFDISQHCQVKIILKQAQSTEIENFIVLRYSNATINSLHCSFFLLLSCGETRLTNGKGTKESYLA